MTIDGNTIEIKGKDEERAKRRARYVARLKGHAGIITDCRLTEKGIYQGRKKIKKKINYIVS
jgi:hypothetical protein